MNAVPGEWLRRFADLCGVTFNRLRFELLPDPGDVYREDVPAQTPVSLSDEDRAGRLPKLTGTGAVDVRKIYGIEDSISEPFPVPEIPKFELSVPGGPPSDVSSLEGVDDPLTRKLGLFRIGICGDSMAPKYPGGTDVIIRATLRRLLRAGQDVYLQFSDGTATFKRIQKIEKDMLSVEAINPKHQPKRLVFPVKQIVYFGRACGIWNEVDCDD